MVGKKQHVQTSRNFQYVLRVAVARSPLTSVRYVIASDFVDNVIFHIMGCNIGLQKTSHNSHRVRQLAVEANSA